MRDDLARSLRGKLNCLLFGIGVRAHIAPLRCVALVVEFHHVHIAVAAGSDFLVPFHAIDRLRPILLGLPLSLATPENNSDTATQ